MPKYNQKPDANQKHIDAAAQAIGAEWIELSKLPGAGADRLYLFQGRMYLVEIKNPAYSWTLTESEKLLWEKCKRQGVEYHTVETAEELVDVLGAGGGRG